MRTGSTKGVIALARDAEEAAIIAAAAEKAGLPPPSFLKDSSPLEDPMGEGGIFVLDEAAIADGAAAIFSALKRRRRNRPLETLILSENLERAGELVELGADDVIGRDEAKGELWIRIKAAARRLDAEERLHGEMEYYKRAVTQEEALSSGLVDLSAAIKDSEEAVTQVRRALRKARGVLEAKNRDPLSGLLNRAGLMERVDAALLSASGANVDISGLMIDIDRFKSINDAHGHLAGDAVLAAVGRRLATGLRKDDFAGRWGGEEFFAVLIGTSREGAMPIAGRIKDSVGKLAVRRGEDVLGVTVSIGVSEYRPGESVADWLKRADDAMYQAKRSGRNAIGSL
jgi:diguanylate cyclase (GGDEF)-like protein